MTRNPSECLSQPPRVPKLLSQASATALLVSHGWTIETGGKHVVKMTKAGCRPITLPHHRGEQYGKDLTSAILRQAGIRRK